MKAPDVNTALEITLKILRALTWKRVGQLTVVMMLAIIGMIAWIDREYIAGIVQPSKLSLEIAPIELTPEVKLAADSLLAKYSQINSVGVVSVNAPANTRRMIYFKSIDREIALQYDQSVARHLSVDVPLFSENAEDNRMIVRLLNGETVCRPWAETISAKYMHDIDVKFVCSVGIPPYYGRFRGIVIIFMRTVPDKVEEHQVRILLRNLSIKLDNPKGKS